MFHKVVFIIFLEQALNDYTPVVARIQSRK